MKSVTPDVQDWDLTWVGVWGFKILSRNPNQAREKQIEKKTA